MNIVKKIVLVLCSILFVGCSSNTNTNITETSTNLLDVCEDSFLSYWQEGVENGAKGKRDNYTILEEQILYGDEKEFIGSVTYLYERHTSAGVSNSTEVYYTQLKLEKNGYRTSGYPTQTDYMNTDLISCTKVDNVTYRKYKDAPIMEHIPYRYQIGVGIQVTFDDGSTWIDVPEEYALLSTLDNTASHQELIVENGIYMDEYTAAVAYGGYLNSETRMGVIPIYITYTHDQGQTWNKVALKESTIASNKHIYFENEQVGYVLTSVKSGISSTLTYLFKTEDGGETWSEINTPSDEIQGFQIVSKDNYLYMTSKSNDAPHLFRSEDNGITWSEVTLTMPQEDAISFTQAYAPIIKNDEYIMYVGEGDNGDGLAYRGKYQSFDSGITWEYQGREEKQDDNLYF